LNRLFLGVSPLAYLLWEHYRCLITLRKEQPALYSANFEI
jgi:hypothetical protein